ncbi:MAG: acyltransferase [Methylococcaceae bacterium]|nr:acyltransferase [Methylococcaceae bacterium]
MRINAFDYYRAIAILFIVSGHSFNPATVTTFSEKVLANLITGGTSLFVFISGFFFHYIFFQKFNYRSFLLKKIKIVFLPYLLLSTLGFLLLAFYFNQLPYSDLFIKGKPTDWQQYLQLYFQYLWSGRLFIAYWYIPFIMIMFALSPIFMWLIKLPRSVQLMIILVFFCVSSITLRPLYNLSPIHSAINFLPVYMMGIVVSINREKVLQFLRGKSFFLGVIVLILAILQVVVYDIIGSFHKESIVEFEKIDIMIWQKLVMCLFFVSVLDKLENKQIPFLKYIAEASFAIFFIHPWVFFFYGYYAIYQPLSFLSSPMSTVFNAVSAVIISLIVAKFIKLIFGRNSRSIIGY